MVKKVQSQIISTILLILITITAIVVVLNFFMPFIKEQLSEPEFKITKEECNEKAEYKTYLVLVDIDYEKQLDYIINLEKELEEEYNTLVKCPDFFYKMGIVGCYFRNVTCVDVEVEEIKFYKNVCTKKLDGECVVLGNFIRKSELSIEFIDENCERTLISERDGVERIKFANQCHKKYPYENSKEINYEKYLSCFNEKYVLCIDYDGYCEYSNNYKCQDYKVERI